MKFYIEQETKVDELKKYFEICYPFLQIALHKMDEKNRVQKKKRCLHNLFLSKLINNQNNFCIDLSPNITITALAKQFSNLGITIEIFRKTGNTLVETLLTENWTLQQQNAEAEELNKHFKQSNFFLRGKNI